QEYAAFCGQPKLFIAIDQEGGQVARLKPPFTQFAGNAHMKDEADAIEFARVTAAELSDIGVNMDMAPVLDVAPKDINSIMAERSFGSDPDWVGQMGAAVINHLQRNKIMAVAKHFPGIGRTVLDSHLELPDLAASMEDLNIDLLPFQKAVDASVAGIMLSHIRYLRIDPVWPASLSSAVVKDLLRDQMGYQGVVMTDDLDMGAIKKHYSITTAMEQIIAAQVDIALICHKGPDIQTAFDFLKAYYLKEDKEETALEPIMRIMALKEDYLT
ncbi:MAG: glycoside hydrolase family 3 N-terminal domain-containing protein, partial [Desulfobacteraceae bacterium]